VALRQRALEERAQQRHVAAAVALDLLDAAFLPPRERLQAVRALRLAQVLLGEMAERKPEADAVADRVEHVEGAQPGEILLGVAAQHLVVDTAHGAADR